MQHMASLLLYLSFLFFYIYLRKKQLCNEDNEGEQRKEGEREMRKWWGERWMVWVGG